VVVSTSDLDSAYRICSVLNDRGLELSHTDILKADIIGNVPESQEVVRRAMDDKEYLLRKVRERFAEQREELTGTANNAGALVRRLEKIETIWANYQRAYAADAISVADLAARRAKLEEERERVKADLERARNLEAELEKLAETERSVCERIQEGYGDLDEAGLQQHREIY
jgi:chromosome segregation ATPase